jgi:hypothetical protein
MKRWRESGGVPGTHTQCSSFTTATVRVAYAVSRKFTAAVTRRARRGRPGPPPPTPPCSLGPPSTATTAPSQAAPAVAGVASGVSLVAGVSLWCPGSSDASSSTCVLCEDPARVTQPLPVPPGALPTARPARAPARAPNTWEPTTHATTTAMPSATLSCRSATSVTLEVAVRLDRAQKPATLVWVGGCMRSRDSTASATLLLEAWKGSTYADICR